MKTALRGKGAARCMVWAAAAFAGAAQAQDPGALNGFRLPPAPTASGVPAEGPVDSEHPVATPTSPTLPSRTPQPAASETPRITLPAVTTAPPRERVRQAEEPRFAPVPMRDLTRPQAEPEAAIEPDPAEVASAEPTPRSTQAPQPARPDAGWGWWLPLLLGLFGLLTIGLFFWWLGRPHKRPKAAEAQPSAPEPSAPAALPPVARTGPRRFLDPPIDPVQPAATRKPQPVVAPPQPRVAATPEAPSRPAPVQMPRPAPEPVAETPRPVAETPPPPPVPVAEPASEAGPQAALDPIGVTLTVRSLQISLVYATLAYLLEVTNRSDTPLTGLRVFGDMISAHASQTSGQQLLLAGSAIEKKHEIASLAPGESTTLKGQIRLPLAEVLPVRAGQAQLFVPLARFLVEATDTPDASHVYSLGQRGDRDDGGMSAFRIDLGPQLFREVLQREVDVARWLQANAARKAG